MQPVEFMKDFGLEIEDTARVMKSIAMGMFLPENLRKAGSKAKENGNGLGRERNMRASGTRE